MKKKQTLVIFIIIVFFIRCSTNTPIDSSKLNKTIENILDSANIPAFSIVILNKENIVYNNFFGVKDSKSKEPIDSNTVFEAASLTKPMTAYCAMRLVAEGKLDLDTPLFKYLEYEPIKYDDRSKLITARMVLSHTSGFPNWRRFNKDKKLDIKFTPGERYSYSGEGFIYLQKVLEELFKKSLGIIFNELVFQPLNMTNSYMVFSESLNYAIGHDIDENLKGNWKPKEPNAAGSLHTTAKDYSKFLCELIEPKFLDKSIINKMMLPQVQTYKDDSTLSYGLGVALQTLNSDTLFWHWGSNPGFRSFFIVSKNMNKGFIYFTNSDMGLSIVDRMIEVIFNDSSIMSGWNKYPQYTDPYFILRNTYKNCGIDSLFIKYRNGKVNESEMYDDEYLLNVIGYYAMANCDFDDAIAIFTYNAHEYPESFNVYYSLGEAHLKSNNLELALENYEKSLVINPNIENTKKNIKKIKNQLE